MEEFKFCPKCSGFLVRKIIRDRKRLICSSCGFVFYQNPKPTVGVFIIENSKVLLAKRAIEPFLGWWDSIGGFMEEGESPEETAARETKEETGLDIELIEILGVGKDVYGKQPIVPIAFIAKRAGGKIKASDDVAQVKWFPLTDLPEKIAFAGNKKALELIKRKFEQDD